MDGTLTLKRPQWLDFPRQGNNNSFQYARRQWNVVDDPLLRYKYLNEFDKAMNRAEEQYGWLHAEPAYVSLKHEGDKMVVYERAGLLFVFNFHPTQSFSDYRVGVEEAGEYQVVLSSDEKRFGGFDRVDLSVKHFTTPMEWNGRKNWLQVWLSSSSTLRYGFHTIRAGLRPYEVMPCSSKELKCQQKRNVPKQS